MLGLLTALEDAKLVDLRFNNLTSAENFYAFMMAYMTESGAGNGYEAYWTYSTEKPREGAPAGTQTIWLRYEFIHTMAWNTCSARLAAKDRNIVAKHLYVPLVGVENGAIVFNFDPAKLPPYLKPEAGDLVRVLNHEGLRGAMGRAVKVRGATCFFREGTERVGRNETGISIPMAQVMKIHDFTTARST